MRVVLLLVLSAAWPLALGERRAVERLLDGWQGFGVVVLLTALRVLLVRTRTRRGMGTGARVGSACVVHGRAGVRGVSLVRTVVVDGRDLAHGRQVRRRVRMMMGSRGRDSSGRIQRHSVIHDRGNFIVVAVIEIHCRRRMMVTDERTRRGRMRRACIGRKGEAILQVRRWRNDR